MGLQAHESQPWHNLSLRSWRDAWAGEAAIFLAGEAREEFSSGEAPHGFATRVHGFATKTKALAHEIPPATQASTIFELNWLQRI